MRVDDAAHGRLPLAGVGNLVGHDAVALVAGVAQLRHRRRVYRPACRPYVPVRLDELQRRPVGERVRLRLLRHRKRVLHLVGVLRQAYRAAHDPVQRGLALLRGVELGDFADDGARVEVRAALREDAPELLAAFLAERGRVEQNAYLRRCVGVCRAGLLLPARGRFLQRPDALLELRPERVALRVRLRRPVRGVDATEGGVAAHRIARGRRIADAEDGRAGSGSRSDRLCGLRGFRGRGRALRAWSARVGLNGFSRIVPIAFAAAI